MGITARRIRSQDSSVDGPPRLHRWGLSGLAVLLLADAACRWTFTLPADPTPCSPPIVTNGAIFLSTPSRIVFQRDPVTALGTIVVKGFYDEVAAGVAPTAIEARWGEASWAVVDASPVNGEFHGELTSQDAFAGRQALEVRFANATDVVDVAEDVGVGDVLLIWGQSNAEQWLTQIRTSLFGGSAHRFDYDPMDPHRVQWAEGSLFRCFLGSASIYPLLLDRWIEEEGVPVMTIAGASAYMGISGFLPGSEGWTTLLANVHDATLGTMKLRLAIGLQGESDVGYSTTEDYTDLFLSFFDALQSELAQPTPMFLGIIGSIENGISVHEGGRGTFAEAEAIREAQRELPALREGVLCRGPDFTGVPLQPDHLHFGEAASGDLLDGWWNTLLTADFGAVCET